MTSLQDIAFGKKTETQSRYKLGRKPQILKNQHFSINIFEKLNTTSIELRDNVT